MSFLTDIPLTLLLMLLHKACICKRKQAEPRCIGSNDECVFDSHSCSKKMRVALCAHQSTATPDAMQGRRLSCLA